MAAAVTSVGCAWATSVLLNCNKDASERSLISLRDVAYIFW
ncbi:hypothetical protein HaLaN_15172 [Haematococcus lacustris]|uniref:Uncharacterized protein n=1 Tax=Haematococcus lacustris TaxID=44745 RepID=A0A699Z6V8_HAELA|nr:hypothetical protein HaLaN_15172 [Haematococcus lacustris]